MTIVKYVLAFIIFVHGLIHVIGFLKGWNLAEIKGLTWETIVPLSSIAIQVLGVIWLLVTLIFVSSAIGLVFNQAWWSRLAIVGVVLSQLLVILWWKDAKFATIPNSIVLAAILLHVV